MKKGKIAPLLCALLCALLCGCQQADEVQDAVPSPYSTAEPSPSPAAETEYGYPPAYGDMGEIMSRYSWGWTIARIPPLHTAPGRTPAFSPAAKNSRSRK